eukprot:1328106-Pyramimonas_sp.AAC.1
MYPCRAPPLSTEARLSDSPLRWCREPIGAGTRGCTRGGNQSEQGQEDIPEVGTNRSRDKRMYPRREPIGAGTRGCTRGGFDGGAGASAPKVDRRVDGSQALAHTRMKRPSQDRLPPASLSSLSLRP